MLTVLLKILSILGVVLLILLGVVLGVGLLVLFLPITYRVEADRRLAEAEAEAEEKKPVFLMRARVKVNWFFGLLRVRYCYPDPGELQVRALWFSLADPSGKKTEKKRKSGEKSGGTSGRKTRVKKRKDRDGEEKEDGAEKEAPEQREEGEKPEQLKADGAGRTESMPEEAEAGRTENATEEGQPEEKQSLPEKIKCTIQKICGKIKRIRDDFVFYRELLLCDDTRGLLDHGFRRIGKILKSVRPRRLKADIRFGTGSPDTTGYAFGIYGMLSPYLGRHVNIRPDFEQAVVEGEISAAGHITVFHLIRHGLMFILDKRLRQLRRKLKEKENK